METIKRGRLIYYEGIDGSGKSTQLALSREELCRRQVKLIPMREPHMEIVAPLLSPKSNQKFAAFLHLADRAEHMPQMKTFLHAGRHVLCDRGPLSTLAYQGAAITATCSDYGEARKAVELLVQMNLFAMQSVVADATIVFDLDPNIAIERITTRDGRRPSDHHIAEIRRAATTYSAYFASRRESIHPLTGKIYRVDASRNREEIHREVMEILEEVFAS